MLGKNRILNKHGLKMVGLRMASSSTKSIHHGAIVWQHDTGHIVMHYPFGALFLVDDLDEKYKECLNSLYGMTATVIIYNGPMTMQEIADEIYEEYREEMAWRETAEENGWRVKE